MKIISWNEEILTGYLWNAPEWVKKAVQAHLACAYCMLDEQTARVAAWLAFYIDEPKVEIMASGQDETCKDSRPLERLYQRLWQFCTERELSVAEAEVIGTQNQMEADAMKRSGMVLKEEEKIFHRLVLSDTEKIDSGMYEIQQADQLSEEERESLIDLLMEEKERTEAFRGDLIPELSLVALKKNEVKSCIFVYDYRGTLLIETFAEKEEKAAKALWQTVRNRISTSDFRKQLCYAEDEVYRKDLMQEEEAVPVRIYTWMDTNLDLLSAEEEEIEMELRPDEPEMGALLLSRLYPVYRMLKEENTDVSLAMGRDQNPQLLVVARSLGMEHLMEIHCIADNVDTGWFRFQLRTEFPGYKDGQEAALLCSRLNRRITDATVYWEEEGNLILQTYMPEMASTDVEVWRQLYRNWTDDCRMITLS